MSFIFQVSVFLLYLTMGKIHGATAPILPAKKFFSGEKWSEFSHPLPSVLILTAIVVSVSTMAVALAIIVNIKRSYRTIEADEIERIDLE